MGAQKVFTTWDASHAALWEHQPVKIGHGLHRSALFQRETLARLIEAYPREHYSLIHMGAPGQRRVWREGEIGDLPGEAVIDAIAQGRMWLNLRQVADVDPRYRALMTEVFGELSERVPGFRAPKQNPGILISSPSAQVYYHADLPGQCLWQIMGAKRVWVYPSTPPFVAPEQLEHIALFDVEVDMAYQPWFDAHAQVFDLGPGEMLHWPLNAPHRVENVEGVNVSMTVSYWTEEIRRRQMVNLANGILRHRFGMSPRGRATAGPAFWAKAVMQRALRDTGWVRQERRSRRPIDFRLDGARPGAIVDLAAA